MRLKRPFLAGLVLAGTIILGLGPAAAETKLRLDYAYYNPVSLVLKDKGWLQQDLAAKGIGVEWVLSQGSNKALEFLNARSIDFGSSAGAAALLSKANGNPIKAVYIYSRPEWTALVTTEKSPITKVTDLKGKKIAVTRGTDPHIFLLRALALNGLTERDVKIVPLQHPEGRLALSCGDVDAWSGLDPFMAQAELEENARLFFRDPALNTYGFLNVREAFAAEHPELVDVVLTSYERGRRWALANPDELARILSEASKVSLAVAERQLRTRTDLSNPIIGPEHAEAITKAGDALKSAGVVPEDIDIPKTVSALIDPHFAQHLASR
jgi:sulfonate transport system substrate-binding protein